MCNGNNGGNVIFGGKPEPRHKKSLYHTLEDHDYWISRNGVCPYCMSGSKPVAKCLIDADGNWLFPSVKELKR